MRKPASYYKYDSSVFVNCPFDPEYKPLLDALAFAIHDCGFILRSALEVVNSGQTRLEKILNIISQCRFGVHDISRTAVSATTSLPRFNMPFEFGMFLGCKHFGGTRNRLKRVLVLDSEAHRYRSSISDIAGQDIAAHANDPNKIIECVRGWLNSERTNKKAARLPGAHEISRRYLAFREDLPAIAKENHLEMTELEKLEYFGDYLELLVAYLKARMVK